MYTVEQVAILDNSMEVFLFEPEGAGPHPGLILAQHIPVGHTGILRCRTVHLSLVAER